MGRTALSELVRIPETCLSAANANMACNHWNCFNSQHASWANRVSLLVPAASRGAATRDRGGYCGRPAWWGEGGDLVWRYQIPRSTSPFKDYLQFSLLSVSPFLPLGDSGSVLKEAGGGGRVLSLIPLTHFHFFSNAYVV